MLKNTFFKNKGLILIVLLALSLLIPSFLAPKVSQADKKEVLANVAKTVLPSPSPTPTLTSPTASEGQAVTPTPTISLPTPTPTVTPTPTPDSTATPTPTPTSVPVNTPTPTPTLTPTITPSETPTPTPTQLQVQVAIDYAGQKSNDSYTTSVNPGQSAWDAVVAAVGINNLQYTDYGGDMGIFINGFNGVVASGNQYFEFKINGVSSMVGVSSYKVNDGDKLDFVLTSF